MWLEKQITQWITLILLFLISSGSSQGQHTDPQLSTKIAVCENMTDIFPDVLPASCTTANKLTRENGGLFDVQVHLNCDAVLHCTWACVSKENQGPKFKVKRGPWTLCEICFNDDLLPKTCFDGFLPHKHSRKVPNREKPPTPTPTPPAPPASRTLSEAQLCRP